MILRDLLELIFFEGVFFRGCLLFFKILTVLSEFRNMSILIFQIKYEDLRIFRDMLVYL